MFTGIVERCGTLGEIVARPEGTTFRVDGAFESLVLGESIAVDGVCLTVARIADQGFYADASLETLARTTLGRRRVGDRVHLERAMRAGDRFGGHVMTGHVDGIGFLRRREALGESEKVVFEVPERLAPFLAPKGSVAVDGVSLTVNGVSGCFFDVALVPHTRRETHFDDLSLDAEVNLEVDVLAKYVARLLGKPGIDG